MLTSVGFAANRPVLLCGHDQEKTEDGWGSRRTETLKLCACVEFISLRKLRRELRVWATSAQVTDSK